MSLMPAEIFSEIYAFLKTTVKSSEVPVKSIIISLLVYAVKEFFKEAIFSCPAKGHNLYGNLFLYGPAAILFCFSLLVSESFWHATTSTCSGRRLVWWKSRKYIYLAILPPIIWLIVAFADGQYFVCSELGPLSTALAAANTSQAVTHVHETFANARTTSQIVAWGLLLCVMFIATIVLTVDRCIAKASEKVLRRSDFNELEAEAAVRIFNERLKPEAEKQAKEVVEEFFERYKNQSTEEQVRMGEEFLSKMYPQYGSLQFKMGMKETRGKKKADDSVQLIESGPHQKYTSIN
ncbi:predicted protein [Nematostella vectensis]|uniref:Uncharacterized protein n=1 Tax=Nematostella vectensis TaxID=45351 RepID=A7RYE0_NEMVE|nr:calcium homeostasis modulator protein 6 [Nematostella vectensis]EDO43444.1 predicted protein [Nematostella vectensis]|eukprot:XP_001635507.1 predicted protein [Nematostella vectensis]